MFLQTDDLPAIYHRYLSAEVIQYIGTVVGTTKLVRSGLGSIKGNWAFALTVVIGGAVGEFQLALLGGLDHLTAVGAGILGGIATALLYKGAKHLGRKVVKLETND